MITPPETSSNTYGHVQFRAPMLVALNADVVNYSRLLADDPDSTVAAMTRANKIVEREVAAADGTLVNFVGDNFMAVFGTAENALKTAIGITTAIAGDSSFQLEHARFRFRMGMDMGGMVITEDGQYLGDALNIAARIQAIAPAGGISVSENVYVALDEPALRFHSIGAKSLKNIPEQIRIYEFTGLPVNDDTSSHHHPLALETPKVTVLPMHTEGIDPSLRASCDILMSNIVTALVDEPHLDVVDASCLTPAEMGQMPVQTGVRYMLSTGAIPSGTGLHLYARIMEVATINTVWAGKWDAGKNDLASMMDVITAEIARTFEVELITGATANIYNELKDPQAVKKVYQGWYHLTTETREGWFNAIGLFEELCDSHPNEPVGPALSAFAHWMGVSQHVSPHPEADLDKARAYALRGLELGDDTGLCDMVLAAISLDEGKPGEALARVESTVITRPTCDIAFALQGSVRRYLGQWQQAISLVDQAMKLTVVNKTWYPTILASSYYLGGRYHDAAATAEEILTYQPRNLEALFVLAAAQVELGLDRRAHATAQQIRDQFPDVETDRWLGSQPYQDRVFIQRWNKDLAAAGLDSQE